jgi:hypothetical protein
MSRSKYAAAMLALSLSTPAFALRPIIDGGETHETMRRHFDRELTSCRPKCREIFEDGERVIQIDEEEAPEAATPMIFLPIDVQLQVVNNPSQPFQIGYTKDKTWGNSLFGAGYRAQATLTASPAVGNAGAKLDAVAEAKAWGKVFYQARDIARARANLFAQQGGDAKGSVELFMIDSTVFSKSFQGKFNQPFNVNRTFFKASSTFTIGPVPVTVTGEANGSAGLTNDLKVEQNLAQLGMTPNARAYVVATAAVNAVVAKFGVSSDLTLLKASLPVRGELSPISCTQVKYLLKGDLAFETLKGSIKAFVKIGFGWFSKKWEKTIARWNGFSENINLFNKSGTANVAVKCDPTGGVNGGVLSPEVAVVSQPATTTTPVTVVDRGEIIRGGGRGGLIREP